MATHDYVIANASGAAVRADLNNALAAIVSNNSSSTEPATTYAYMWWVDTANGQLKQRNAANDGWVTVRELDGTLLMEDGTAASPGLSFASDLDTGLFRAGTNAIGIATNGVERVEFGTSEVVFNDGGNDIDFRIEGDTQANLFVVDAGNDSVSIGGDVTITDKIIHAGDTDTAIRFPAADVVAVETAGSEAARIDSSGRLLVGTSTSRSVGIERIILGETTNNTAGISLVRNTNDGGGSSIALAKSRGTVVGSSTIVQNNDLLGAIFFVGADGGDINTAAADIRGEVDGTPGANDMPGRLVFSTTADGDSSATERMRITSDGRILFGTTGTPNGTSVYGSAFTPQTNGRSTLFCATSSTASQKHAIFYNPNGEVGSISTSASATAYTTSSDYRLKENVTPVIDGIARLQQLKPSRFNFIADPDTVVDGFIAHEVQTIVPEAITGEKDAVDDDGNPIYQGIDQSKLVPLLTAALQEAVAKIESLEARLAAAGI